MAIQKLGHVGIYANDLENMRDFYTRVVGLQIADEAPNAVFMSVDPEREHHEFVIFRSSDLSMAADWGRKMFGIGAGMKILGEVVPDPGEFIRGLGVQRVEHLRPIDRHVRDAAALLVSRELVRHKASPPP